MKLALWLLVVVMAILIAAEWARGQAVPGYQVVLRWDANTEADLAGYRLYWSTNGGSGGFVRDCGLVRTQSIALGSRGPWIFRATAYNTAGMESLPSSNLSVTFPGEVGGLRLVAGSVTVTTNWILVP